MYKENPEYRLLFSHGKYNVYFLKDDNIQNLHMSRKVEASIQNEYSNSGATATYIQELAKRALTMLENDPKNDLLRQNQISLWNQLLYRTQYPVDSLCGIRMGAILSFLEYEVDGKVMSEPVDAQLAWINKKVEFALENPDAYTFFLNWGIGNTPSYSKHLGTLKQEDYFSQRKQMEQSFYPLANG